MIGCQLGFEVILRYLVLWSHNTSVVDQYIITGISSQDLTGKLLHIRF